MNNILMIIFFILISIFSYFLVEFIFDKNIGAKITKYIDDKNKKYYEDLIKYYSKNKKVVIKARISIIYKLNILIDKAGLRRNLLINPISIIIFCIASFIICYLIIYSIFKVILLSIIISLPITYLPIAILNLICDYKNSKIEKAMLDFLLQLKNYTEINNDIIYAFKQVKTIEPLQGYINKFLVEVNSGIKFEKAIENLKEKIVFVKFKSVFSGIEHCYLYGGDYRELMDRSYKMIAKVQKEKASRIQETKSARIVLRNINCFGLICLF